MVFNSAVRLSPTSLSHFITPVVLSPEGQTITSLRRGQCPCAGPLYRKPSTDIATNMALAEIENSIAGVWVLQKNENLDEYLKEIGECYPFSMFSPGCWELMITPGKKLPIAHVAYKGRR